MAKISEKQKLFIDQLLTDPEMHQTRAYMAVYTNVKKEAAAAVNATRLLKKPHVQEYLRERMKAREKRTEITQDRVLQELAKIAFADIKEFVSFRTEKTVVGYNDDGSPIFGYASVIEMIPSDQVDGTVVNEVRLSDKGTFSFKLQDKLAALDKLARHLGMFQEAGPVVNIHNNPFAGLSTEELRKLIRDG